MQYRSMLARATRIARSACAAALAACACTTVIPPFANAAAVTLRWDYTASGAAGFMLYCGLATGRYTAIVDTGNTDTYTLSGLAEGQTYQCAVTAYDAARTQSDYSVPVRFYLASAGRCATACDGDFNHDGHLDALDVGLLKTYWGSSYPDADLNGDGTVNVLDLGIFKSLFQ